MSGITLGKEIRERVSTLAKRRKEAGCTDKNGEPSGHTFDSCLAWCVSVGVKRQDTLDRFAAAKKKERKAAAKGKPKAAKKATKPKAEKKAKTPKAKKPAAAKKPAKAKAPKAAKSKRAKKSAAEEAPVEEAAE